MSTYELTADPSMIENIRAGDVDGYVKEGQWFFNPASIEQEAAVEDKSEQFALHRYVNSSEKSWLKNPTGRLQFFGWMFLIGFLDRVSTAASSQSNLDSESSGIVLVLLGLAIFLFGFIVVRKREIDVAGHFRMTWRSWLYIVSNVVAFVLTFTAAYNNSLDAASSEVQAMLLGGLIFIPAHLSLLFQPGYLWNQKQKRKKMG